MSATGSSCPQGQGGAVRRSFVGPAKLIKAGALAAAVGLATGLLASATDAGELQQLTRVAALGGGEPEPFTFQPGLPVRESEIDADLKLLLAQAKQPVKSDAEFGEDTILVALALPTPESVDEDIAKQHGLELVDRTELSSLSLRIVRYRAPGNQPIAPILAALRNDQRVRRAQANVQYTPLPAQSAPATTEASAPKDVPAVAAKLGGDLQATVRRRSDRKTAAVDGVAQRLAEQAPPPPLVSGVRAGRLHKDEPVNASAPQPLRVGKVGDVLSGGL